MEEMTDVDVSDMLLVSCGGGAAGIGLDLAKKSAPLDLLIHRLRYLPPNDDHLARHFVIDAGISTASLYHDESALATIPYVELRSGADAELSSKPSVSS